MTTESQFPRIGMRNIKTGISATLCALIYELGDRNATFACIGAVFGMDSNLQRSLYTGGNRLIGTVIGGFLGMLLFYLHHTQASLSIPFHLPLPLFLLAGVTLLIFLCQLFHVPGSIQAGAVVFFIVMLNTPENEYVSYAINRMIDTGFGVLMSILINDLLSVEVLEKLIHRWEKDHSKQIKQIKKTNGFDRWLESYRHIPEPMLWDHHHGRKDEGNKDN
ncbi:MAG: aromatic acid exporter family protein [Clostridiales bacterium]